MLKLARSDCRLMRSTRGFTLLEFLVALCLLAVLAAAMLPQITDLMSSFDRRNARQEFEYDLRRARSEALSKGVRVVITLAASGKTYTVGTDSLPYDTTSGAPDQILFQTNLPNDVTLSFSGSGSDATKLIFTSRGFLSDIAGNRSTSQRTATLSYDGHGFVTATVYPIGVAAFN